MSFPLKCKMAEGKKKVEKPHTFFNFLVTGKLNFANLCCTTDGGVWMSNRPHALHIYYRESRFLL